MNRRSVLWSGGLALGALVLSPLAARSPALIWNASTSAPIGLYRVVADDDPAVGARVAWRPPSGLADWIDGRGYVPRGVPLLKPVAATGPSVVCRSGARVMIDGRPVAEARVRDRAGRPLPWWSGCRKLTSDEAFLLAPNVPDSLDSRYFGPVPRAELLGRVEPLWLPEPRP